MSEVADRLEGLRCATADVHARLHLHPAFAALTGRPPALGGYARLLGQLHGFHVPVEAVLFPIAERCLPALDDLPRRRKAHLLAEDLETLAAAVPSETFAFDLDPGLPALLGSLYVIEGATLGGRELARGLAPVLRNAGLEPPAGCGFLLAYAPDQGAMWRRFCRVLSDAAVGFVAAEHRQMDDAARRLFLALERWLTDGVAASTHIVATSVDHA